MSKTEKIIAELRQCREQRAAATNAAFFGATEQDRTNATANQHWIDREIVRLALELAAAEPETSPSDELADKLGNAAGMVIGLSDATPISERARVQQELLIAWNEWKELRISQRGPDGYCHGRGPKCGDFGCPVCHDDFE